MKNQISYSESLFSNAKYNDYKTIVNVHVNGNIIGEVITINDELYEARKFGELPNIIVEGSNVKVVAQSQIFTNFHNAVKFLTEVGKANKMVKHSTQVNLF
jgi:hypothetical protein